MIPRRWHWVLLHFFLLYIYCPSFVYLAPTYVELLLSIQLLMLALFLFLIFVSFFTLSLLRCKTNCICIYRLLLHFSSISDLLSFRLTRPPAVPLYFSCHLILFYYCSALSSALLLFSFRLYFQFFPFLWHVSTLRLVEISLINDADAKNSV